MDYNKPHEIRDEKKLQSMIDTLRAGGELPPVLVIGYNALTGSHRLAAWEACDRAAIVIELSDEDYIAAMRAQGLNEWDEIYDYSDFCRALYEVTGDPEIKAAVADQRE